MARMCLTLGIVMAMTLSSIANADTWGFPRAKLFANGHYGFRILPQKSVDKTGEVSFPSTEGTFFMLDEQGKDKVIWHAKLVNMPIRAIVAESGKYVITLDSWGRVGYEHCLVVYGEKGKVIADFKLEDLLTAKEIESLPASVTIRGWSDKDIADFEDRSREDELIIRMKHKGWAKIVRLTLSTGKFVTE